MIFCAKQWPSQHIDDLHHNICRVNDSKAPITQGAQHIPRCPLPANEGTDKHPCINDNPHRLSFSGFLDISRNFLFAELCIEGGETVPNLVETSQHFTLFHLLVAEIVFVGDQYRLWARSARQDERRALANHALEKGTKFALEFCYTDNLLHIRLLVNTYSDMYFSTCESDIIGVHQFYCLVFTIRICIGLSQR